MSGAENHTLPNNLLQQLNTALPQQNLINAMPQNLATNLPNLIEVSADDTTQEYSSPTNSTSSSQYTQNSDGSQESRSQSPQLVEATSSEIGERPRADSMPPAPNITYLPNPAATSTIPDYPTTQEYSQNDNDDVDTLGSS